MTQPAVTDGAIANIAAVLPQVAQERPYAPAIIFPHGRDAGGNVAYTHYTYRQLDELSDAIAAGLEIVGAGRGVRTVLMVTPSLEFFALAFGLFKAGAVPVIVDPGIGLKSLKVCLAEAEPEAFIGIPAAHAARLALGWGRGTIKTPITVGRRLFWGGSTLEDVKAKGRAHIAACAAAGTPWSMAATRSEETAAVLFTSGSTGVPKGVVYRHGVFLAQVERIKTMYDIQPGEVDLPTFPLFALFDPAFGMTTIWPDMDPRNPAGVDPTKLIEAIEDFGVTNMFGSPALLNTLSRYGAEHGIRLPTLKRVITAGAPVSATVMQRTLDMLGEGGRIHTPYGATECLPVSSIDSHQVLGETRHATDDGKGVCVGRPHDRALVRIIRITDDPIADWSDDLMVPDGEIGEIVVKGPMVTWSYYNRAESTAAAKIQDGDDVRHRMGDVGYFDSDGRLWFCGRKGHRVETADGPLFTMPCEGPFNAHPAVFRTALVGVGEPGKLRPVLCVELESDSADRWDAVKAALADIAKQRPQTQGIQTFLRHSGFPVDIRHNAKIGREALTIWAEGRK